MAESARALVSFNAGEWSPRLHSRVDLEKAGSAARLIENMVVETYGRVRRRPGTRFIYEAFNPGAPVVPTSFLFESRLRTGTASMLGFPEFTDPSTPPRFYKTHTAGGSAYSLTWPGYGSCPEPAIDFNQDDFSGSCYYTEDGVLHSEMVYDQTNSGGTVTTTGCFNPGLGHSPLGDTSSATRTTRNAIPGSGCRFDVSGYAKRVSNTCFETLSNEDTEDLALIRLWAGMSWGSWATVGTPSSFVVSREVRTDVEFSVTERQFRFSYTGLIPSRTYRVRTAIKRRLIGVGSFVVVQTLQTFANSDGSGNLVVTGTVPNVAGYESYADTPTINLSV